MRSDYRSSFLKQLRHLCLSQPNRFIFQPGFDLSDAIFSLIYNDITFLFHYLMFKISCSNPSVCNQGFINPR